VALTSRLGTGLWGERGLPLGGPVAGVRSMRWRRRQRCSSRREETRPGRASPHWQRARSQPRLASSGQGVVVVRFHLAGLPILGRPAWLQGIGLEAVVSQRRAQIAAEQAVRLGAQELRPAGADPPRGRPQARAPQHGRDRGGRDADAELQQLTLDRISLPHSVRDPAECERASTRELGERAARARSLHYPS
jgi:hypothetical protein